MKPSLQLKLSQHLALTPQLQQSIKLLQLSTLELEQELEKYLLENPLLEREDGGSDPVEAVTEQQTPASLDEAFTGASAAPEDANLHWVAGLRSSICVIQARERNSILTPPSSTMS